MIKKGLIYIAVIGLYLFVASVGSVAFASNGSVGPTAPGTVGQTVLCCQYAYYDTPANVKVQDNTWATSGAMNGSTVNMTQRLQATNFGFAIPANAVIDSFTITFVAKDTASAATTSPSPTCWMIGGTETCPGYGSGSQSINSSTGTYTITYTNDSASTGISSFPLTPAQVNASNFGFELGFYGGSGANTVSVDYVALTVNYTTPAAPSVTTDANLYSIRSTDAVLTGSVVSNTLATTATFAWDTTNKSCNTLGHITASTSVPATGGNRSHIVTQPLTGLTANTTYYYCLYANNTSGVTYGPVYSFTTNSTAVGAVNATSALSPTVSSNTGIGTYNGAWTSVSNVYANDGAYATCSATYPSTPYYCSYILTSGYGFNVPANATITGFAVDVKGMLSQDINDGWNIQLYKNIPAGTGYIGQYFPTLAGTINQYTVASYGTNNLWGATAGSVTPADVNGANFGVWLSNTYLGYGTYSVDHIRLTVYYTLPSNPIVSSPTSASITNSGATLGGNITDQGGSAITARGVCYSVTATNANPQSGGTGVTCVAQGGTGTGVFTTAVSGLNPYTAYSFTVYGTNSQGTGYSTAGTFTTLGAPVITTGAAANITNSAADLTSTVNPSSSSTNVSYLWGTTNNSCSLLPNTLPGPVGLTGAVNISPNTTNLSGLTGNTVYYYCVTATNAYGTSYGSVTTLNTNTSNPGSYTMMDAGSALGGGVTDCNDASAGPCPPTGVSAVAASGTQNNVTWSAPSSGPAATSYNLVWCSGASCTPATTITGVTSVYGHTGLTCNTVYGYQLIAVNAAGSSTPTTTVYATSGACSTVPSITAQGATSITGTGVTFTSSGNGNGASTTLTYRYGTSNVACSSLPSTASGGVVGTGAWSNNQTALSGLTGGTTYYYCATANNSQGTTNGVSNNNANSSFTTLPSPQNVYTAAAGTYYGASMDIPSDNMPVIVTSKGLYKCNNTSCTSSTQENASIVSKSNSSTQQIDIGTDGNPIAISGNTVYKCSTQTCASGTTTALGITVNNWSSIAVPAADGLPVIAYNGGGTYGSVGFAKCANSSCTSLSSTTTLYTGTLGDSAGANATVIIGGDGLPFVAFGRDYYGVETVHCGNSTCTSGNTSNLLVNWYNAGNPFSYPVYISMDKSSAGFAQIAVTNEYNSCGSPNPNTCQLQIYYCSTAVCLGQQLATPGYTSVYAPAIKVSTTDTFPVMGFGLISGNNRGVVGKCNGIYCSGFYQLTDYAFPYQGGNWEWTNAVGIDSNNIPWYFFETISNGGYIVKCNNSTCQ